MSLKNEGKGRIIQEYQRGKTDTGSPEVQIALLSSRISQLTEHFNVHKKDTHSRHGLLHLVNRRRNLLDYLKSTDSKRYQEVISRLELRR